jgi:DNA-binding CsgD family transcriptional regulator
MTRRPTRHPAERATDREVGVVAAVLETGSEKAAAHRLGLSHSTVKHRLANARSKVGAETTAQLVWILAPRLSEPDWAVDASEALDALHAPGAVGTGAAKRPSKSDSVRRGERQ